MSTLLISILVLSALILIHELGHFLAAKLSRIKVEEFGLGLPPRLVVLYDDGETKYSINLLPIGGFVRLHGETPDQAVTEPERSFSNKSILQRGFVLTAGIGMNYLLGLLLIAIVIFQLGVPRIQTALQIGEVMPDSPAHQAGLSSEDLIVAIKSAETTEFKPIGTEPDHFKNFVDQHVDQPIEFKILNRQDLDAGSGKLADHTSTVALTPRADPPEGEGALGITFGVVPLIEYEPVHWVQVPAASVGLSIEFVRLMFEGLGGMVRQLAVEGTVPTDVAGPVGIAVIIGDTAKQGLTPLLQLTALISINLAVINILPIPALDGGRLLFLVIEAVTQRKLNPQHEALIHTIGMIALLILIAAISLADVRRFF